MIGTSLQDTLANALRERGQRVTPQRLAVAGVVEDLNRHVTAEHVHGEVTRRFPGVSLPTVYATLDLLEDLALLNRVPAPGGSVVYDPRTDQHHHFVCHVCNTMTDLDGDVDAGGLLAAARAAGMQPAQAEVVLRGVCSTCAQNGG